MKNPGKIMQLSIALILMCPIFSFGQTPTFNDSISVNQTFTSTSEIYPFSGQTVYGIGVSGSVTYANDFGYAKIILRDSLSIDYLIYDINYYLNQDSTFSFFYECEETCFMDGFTPTSVEIIANSITVTLNKIHIHSNSVLDAATLQEQARTSKLVQKVALINNYIDEEGLIWIADTTQLVKHHYNNKKNLCEGLYSCPLFEYYSKGIFSIKNPGRTPEHYNIDYSYVDNFDWRNRHGANNPLSYYYDGIPDGSGWVTGASCQNGCFKRDNSLPVDCSIEQWQCTDTAYEWRGAPTCWAFGPTSYLEALVNLYLNKHIDYDLAEQELVSCIYHDSIWDGTKASPPYDYFINSGIVEEQCFPYIADEFASCTLKCETPYETIKIHEYEVITNPTISQVKDVILKNGPISASGMYINPFPATHAMQLVGWDIIKWGDTHINGFPPDSIDIINYLGLTYWIYKENLGDRSEMHGFKYIIHFEDHPPTHIYPIKTDTTAFVYSLQGNFDVNDIECLDNDNDGYFNWGIGPKPPHCPSCWDEPDGDDNNSGLGPIDSLGFCSVIGTYNSRFENTLCNWKQSDQDDCDWRRFYGEAPQYPVSGPGGTPDSSDYYIYMSASTCGRMRGAHLISPDLKCKPSGVYEINFAFHKNSEIPAQYTDTDNSKLAIDISYDNGITWDTNYWFIGHDQGNIWHYQTVSFPPEVNKVRFNANVGWVNTYNDIAIDDVTITPVSNTDIHITSDETWALQNYAVGGDLIIEPNATLTMSGTTVYFNDYKKIVVKPGAKMIMNDATLTNYNGQWTGIQVWGDTSANQFQNTSGDYQQGYLKINEDSEINNAIIAVDLWNSGDYASTGGIVYADKCTFKNNSKAVHALNYTNYYPTDPGKETFYFSEFRDCEFRMDSEFYGYEAFRSHVDIANIEGLTFKGCYFQTIQNLPYAAETMMAINAYNAQFQVKDYCDSNTTPCPQNDLISCTFTNFDQAINALGDISSVNTFYVNNAKFYSNRYGIRTIDVHNAIVLNSDFYIYTDSDCAYGIYAEGVSGFAFEENYFTKSVSGSQANYFGISITNSESVNQIYKNDFNGLSYANFADGKNWIGQGGFMGLEYTCNLNNCNYADFFVVDDSTTTETGIQNHQGTNTLAAGNTFSPRVSTCSEAEWHFYNGGEHDVDYFFYGGGSNELPDAQKIHETNPFSSTQNPCPSHYGSGATEVVMDGQQKSATESSFLTNYNDYNSVKLLYDSYVDGGNTSQELLDIECAQPQDMWALRAQLLGDSPHLSLEVLIAASDKTDVLTESALFDILAANPDELKKDTLIYYLENKAEPLPQYMINLLIQLSQGTTYKSALQQDMGFYKHGLTRDAYDIIRSNLNDTSKNLMEFRNWQDNLGGLVADRQIIASYVKEHNFADAYSLANMLPSLYGLQGKDLTEHGYFMDMLGFYEDIQNRNIFQIDSLEVIELEYIASNSQGAAGRYANNILQTVLKENYACCPDLPGTAGYKNRPAYFGTPMPERNDIHIIVKPNPARTWAAFEYKLPDATSYGVLSIYSASGRKVLMVKFENIEGQYLWDTRSVPNGVYYYTLECKGVKKSGKFIVN